MKVNMTPNPLDVVTIHASQGDTEARQWEFELHNNGELIDTSGVTDQMVFKAYKGGTEQILPENTSTPTTSPFKGDIRYPQGLLTDQEFLYRESPTEEDGLAKITDIKGNTLVWNQLVDTDTSSVTLTSGHKFITKVNGAYSLVDGTGQSLSVTGGTDEVFDLTKMGLDSITSADEFTSLFPLSFYDYNASTLLSFNGTGLKSASEDLSKEDTLQLPIATYYPTGMKSAGSAYDELTENKAITRIGSVDLGSLNWSYVTTGSVLAPYFRATFSGIKSQGNPATNKANILCSKYQTVARNDTNFVDKTICADGSPTVLTQIQIKDSSYTDATAFKNSLQGQYLYYELATPTETSFTTASLVTENAEIPLSNEDGVLLGKCTEQLSENPGFIDAKIKLSDADGECYSNKIQLHVERSPQ